MARSAGKKHMRRMPSPPAAEPPAEAPTDPVASLRRLRVAVVARLVAELAVILAWAAFVGRTYLSFDPHTMPAGFYNEFGTSVMSHAVWTNVRSCGLCVLWNGAINGGSPAFVDVLGAPLHPLVILPTILWSTIVGGKVAVVASLAMAGLGQWWLARVMQLGPLARVWSALLVVSGGHLAGRMEQGVVAVVLSTAACSLLLAPLLDVLLTGRRRSAILLGITSALAIVAGQGYLQLGVVLGFGPATLLLLLRRNGTLRPQWREVALALGLAALLASVFLVPLAHFWPEFDKDSDRAFRSAQPLGYMLLNLVIDDSEYFAADQLGKQPFPFLYINYIGWVPILFAIAAVRLIPRDRLRLLLFFVAALGGVFFAASAAPFRLLALVAPDAAASVRNSVLIAGLAVPLIAGLAAYGVDRLLKLPWPTLFARWRPTAARSRRAIWPHVLVLAPLLWSLASVYSFSRPWTQVTPRDPMMEPVFEQLRTDTASWVAAPHGRHVWIPPALDAGLKLTGVLQPWHWAGRSEPKPRRSAAFDVPAVYWARIGDIFVVDDPANMYAAVRNGAIRIPCSTHARGGNIDVECAADTTGVLEVQEHRWTGWHATRDGATIPLQEGEWLRVEAPEGPHRYTFRYRPWDVALGAALSCVGAVLAGWLWRGSGNRETSRQAR